MDRALRLESGQTASATVDLDDPLEEATKINYWRRYQLRYPAEIMPSDCESRDATGSWTTSCSLFTIWTMRCFMCMAGYPGIVLLLGNPAVGQYPWCSIFDRWKYPYPTSVISFSARRRQHRASQHDVDGASEGW